MINLDRTALDQGIEEMSLIAKLRPLLSCCYRSAGRGFASPVRWFLNDNWEKKEE
jgi:hypothetical protein